jgi:PKD repeat protein
MKLTHKHILFCFLLFLHIKLTISQVNSIPGLVFWIAGDSVRISSGNQIDKCFNLSSVNNNAIQTTFSKQPTSIISSLNGHKSILFDGVDDYLTFNEVPDIRTVFWVVKEAGLTTPNYRPLLGHTTLNDFHRGIDSLIWYNGAASSFVVNGITKLNLNQINGTNTSLNSKYSLISLVTTNNVKADNFSNDRIAFGRVWSGELAELIIYNQALTPSQVIQIETYLINKYTPSVNLGPDIPISQSQGCTPSNSITIQANPNFQSYLWNTGNTTNQINVNQYGRYSVICTDIFGIQHYDTVKVIPTPKNFNYPSHILCGNGNSITWDTQLNHNANTFQWQDNSTDSLLFINSPGQYYLTVTDTYGCAYTSNTLTVTQDNFSSQISLGPDLSICSGNSIYLTNGAGSTLSYTWSNGSHNDSLLINTTGQYSVVVTNTNNCVAKDTINVTVLGQAPSANFFTSVGCKNSAVSFTNSSIAPSGNSISNTDWNFGDPLSASNTSTLSNPFHTFSDTGFYSIRLKVITNVGCEQSITKTIHVTPTPTANFSNGISCQNDTTSFSSSIVSSAGYSITSLAWNFGDPASGINNVSNLSSPKHVFGNQTNYPVTLLATNNAGCTTSLTKSINVKAEVKASFTNSPPCANTATIFQDNSIVPPPSASSTRLWDFGTNTASGLTVSKTYTSSGVYSVSLTVTGTNGCVSKISKQIIVFLPPVASFTVPSFCSKDTITVTNQSLSQSGIISSYNWKLNNIPFSTVQNPTLTASAAGTYLVKLTVVNSFNCKDSITKPVTVLPLPNVDFTTNPASYYYINSPISFIPNINNANSYLRNITGVPSSIVQSPTVSFNTEGSYTVSLNLENQQGCKNSKTKTILVSIRYLDLAILNINTLKDNDGFITVEADIANNVPVSTFDIHYQISDAGNIKETWNGTLNPNSFYVYTFNSKSGSQKNSSNNITCVEIEKVNGIIDGNTSNNNLCNTLNTNDIDVSNPLPNPTNGDITLPVILNKDVNFTISIYNSVGQIIYEETTQKGITGLNFVTLQTSTYSRGCYIIKTSIENKIFIKKFIKISNE